MDITELVLAFNAQRRLILSFWGLEGVFMRAYDIFIPFLQPYPYNQRTPFVLVAIKGKELVVHVNRRALS
jgi:hypothetical protein